MLEYAATSGITGGIGKAFDEADILGKEQYLRVFARTAAIATAVELFKVSVGLENKINIQFILEQAIAATIGAKLNSGLANVNSSVVNGADELEKTAVGAAFGYQQSAAILAQNYLEDEANTGADILASKAIQPQPSASTMVLAPSSSSSRNSGSGSSMGDVSVPSNFNSPALQTESRFISSSLSGDDVVMSDPIQSFYTASQDILRDDLDSMSAASAFALNSRVESNVTEVHAKQLQRSAARVVNSPGWLSQEIYDHQHSWWAKGILGFTGAINSDAGQWLSRSLNTDGASAKKMDPFSAMGNTAAGYDPITGQAIGIEQGYKNFGESMAGMFGGEVAGVGVGIGLGFAADTLPSVGRNIASMFGHGGVSNSIADEFDDAVASGLNPISHPLEGLTPEKVIQHVNQLGLKTPRDQLILWSGLGRGSEGVRLSQEYAAENGGVTLELTPGGKWLDKMDLFGANSPFTQAEARQIWGNVSVKMIQQASGQVRSLIGTVNPASVYRAEQAELFENKNVLGLDELNLKPRYGFGNF